MAKAIKKKSSNIFHDIVKASVQPKKEINSEGARQWYPYQHPTTGKMYTIRYYYEEGDKTRKCTVSLQSKNTQEPDEQIANFSYPANRQDEVDEKAKMVAIHHGDMQPPDFIT